MVPGGYAHGPASSGAFHTWSVQPGSAVLSGYGQGWRILSTRIRRTSTVCPPDQHAAAAALI